ncbi:MAG TPA: GFA family protein [Steroidobacteraceae bacterium]|nr:GFA family protein [Steroidobacteraceae bacterium]
MTDHQARCFCGAVQFTVSGAPVAMGYCHCESCRHWSAGPVNAFTLWQPGAVQVTRGSEHIGTYHKTDMSHRKWCKLCGGHLFAEHPPLNLTDVFAAMLPALEFKPGVHVNYQETVLRMKDGLPKLKDFPKEFGGSGVVLAE